MEADRRILVHGHRGARAVLPENTIPGFRYAIEKGVDFVELDVLVTKDNVVVVTHDPQINPIICSGPRLDAVIRDLTWGELSAYDCGAKQHPAFPHQQPVPGARMPSLDEVFALGGDNRVRFNIEPKFTPAPHELFAELILDLIRKHDLAQRVLVQSFDYRTLHAMKQLDSSIPCGALFQTDRAWEEVAYEFRADAINPQFRLVTAERVAWAHKNGFQVMPWTANQPEEWATLAEAGVDGIITDDPAALIAWLESKGLR